HRTIPGAAVQQSRRLRRQLLGERLELAPPQAPAAAGARNRRRQRPLRKHPGVDRRPRTLRPRSRGLPDPWTDPPLRRPGHPGSDVGDRRGVLHPAPRPDEKLTARRAGLGSSPLRRLGIAALLALAASCASVPHRAASREPSLRSRVVRSARGRIGEQSLSLGGRALPADCLSLPRAAYGENGIELGAPTAAALYSKVRRDGHWFSHGTPRRADLVFLRDAAGGSLHVGLVEDVERDGTVIVL